MLGAVIGDIAGSAYECDNIKTEKIDMFGTKSRFTDISVMTAATAAAVSCLKGNKEIKEDAISKEYAKQYKLYYAHYPLIGYGQKFTKWAQNDRLCVQGSYGNGASMRVSPIGYAFDSLKEVLYHAEKSCLYTHNNREAISGAQAVAGSVFMARCGKSKGEIRRFVQKTAGYNLNFKLENIKKEDSFSNRTKLSVPFAITAFLESYSFESAVRKAVAIGGDSGKVACIAGAVSEAFYQDIPKEMKEKALAKLDAPLRDTVTSFHAGFMQS